MGAGMVITGILGATGAIAEAVNYSGNLKRANKAREDTAKLIADTQAKEDARRQKAENDAAYYYEKEQKMTAMKETALQKELNASQKYRRNNSTILTERMLDKSSVQTVKQSLGSF